MTLTVLTAEFSHETNTFNIRPTDHAAFANQYCLFGDDAVKERKDGNTDLAGFLQVAAEKGWQVRHTLSTAAPPAGRVTRDAFDRLSESIVAPLRADPNKFDGLLLGLHGAMATDYSDDGEGDLLQKLRVEVGPDLPIAITLDPHANVTAKMCDLADIIVSYNTYPHVDMRNRARLAAEILHRTMFGEIRPKTIYARRPMLEEVNGGRTDIGPMIERHARARDFEINPDVFAVSINGGFGNADIVEIGPTVLVTGEGDFQRHQRFAEAIADDIWARRFESLNAYLSVKDAAITAKHHKAGDGPLIIADYADNPGGGGYGDGTALLSALIAADVEDACFGPMVDPEVAAFLFENHSAGETVSLLLGGKTDPAFGGGPIDVTGTLMHLSLGDHIGDGPMMGGLKRSWGMTAVLRIGGIDVLVVTKPNQMLDLQQFKAFGIDPERKSVVALKSMQHFRAAFEPIASQIIVCDSGALCTPDLAKLPYKNVPRPIHPLD